MISRRRSLAAVAGAMLIGAFPVMAQPKAARIAVLGSGHAQSSQILLDGLVQGLRDNGLIPGRDVVLDVRWAEGHYERFAAQTAELLALQPRLLMVTTISAARAAQEATRSVPIVLISINDPVGAGLVATLPRPGGNTTGIANMAEDLTPKVVEMLRTVLPRARGVTVLLNRANASNVALLERTRVVAAAAGLSVQTFDFSGAEQLEALQAALARQRPDALLVLPDSSLLDQRDQPQRPYQAMRERRAPECEVFRGLEGIARRRIMMALKSAKSRHDFHQPFSTASNSSPSIAASRVSKVNRSSSACAMSNLSNGSGCSQVRLRAASM